MQKVVSTGLWTDIWLMENTTSGLKWRERQESVRVKHTLSELDGFPQRKQDKLVWFNMIRPASDFLCVAGALWPRYCALVYSWMDSRRASLSPIKQRHRFPEGAECSYWEHHLYKHHLCKHPPGTVDRCSFKPGWLNCSLSESPVQWPDRPGLVSRK